MPASLSPSSAADPTAPTPDQATVSSPPPRPLRERERTALVVAVLLTAVVAGVSAAYEVQPGDTLAEIAAAHGTTVSELAAANGIDEPDLIRIGSVLTIPGQGGEAGAGDGLHVIQPGESLARIAQRYGVTVSALVEANDIPDPDLIRPGRELLIPASGQAPGGGPEGEADQPQATVHVVAPGESLATIAALYGTTVEAIAAANGITDPSVIYAGTSLLIGAGAAPVLEGSGGSATHTVAPGETLGEIAARYGTSVEALVAENGLRDPNHIVAGGDLSVPSSGWVCPVAGARYFNDWGFPRSGGRFHQGNDLFAPRGTEVRAPVSGQVDLRTGSVGGLQFWLTGDDGNVYIGTHLEAFGQAGRVEAGDVIGYVGDSGNALGSEPHLHLEVQVAGSPVNPYPTLVAHGC